MEKDNGVRMFDKQLNDLKYFCNLMLILICFAKDVHNIRVIKDSNKQKKRKRKSDMELMFHQKRKRQLWSPLVRSLGPHLFYTHHRVAGVTGTGTGCCTRERQTLVSTTRSVVLVQT